MAGRHQLKSEEAMDIHRGKGLSFLAGLGVGARLALSDSARGARKRTQARLEKTPRTNHELAARVCAELDHDVEHGKGIQVFADDNRVTLRGVALRDELHDVLS